MLFPTLTFGVFFLITFAVVWSAPSNEWRKILLLVASWVFYGAWDWRFVPLLSFFPRLVAGPIVRAADLVPQFQSRPKLDRSMVSMALLLIVWGLFKKTVIASELAVTFVDPVFADPASHSALDLVFAAYGYAV